MANFSANMMDPKASILITYNFLLGEPSVLQVLFYNTPNLPPGIFNKFMDIPFITRDVGT
ncbi:hypothetical protein P691DRAFT_766754 [Macrolepiota fuliginosa MF-IS2]|uniref:Uncharacterized protein n=1 Tax=Macrolepiota fuliginosa MF-IS2 TaxID=1400762 RepID=A0A9P5X097_9AGAR|nr:hypothetical protein P691DRAFT_766754 [Macrolepiota fuliginosa MF-IS2]